MSIPLLVCIIIISVIAAILAVIIYVRLLEFLWSKLLNFFTNKSDAGSYCGSNGHIPISCIHCLNYIQKIFCAKVIRQVCRVIKYFIRNKPVRKPCYDKYDESCAEYSEANLKRNVPIPLTEHKGIIKRLTTKSKRNLMAYFFRSKESP
jgi:hypothetical protein